MHSNFLFKFGKKKMHLFLQKILRNSHMNFFWYDPLFALYKSPSTSKYNEIFTWPSN